MDTYMVVETFKPEFVEIIINSWVNKQEGICFQLMRTNDAQLIDQWTEVWKDHIDFKIIKVDKYSNY